MGSISLSPNPIRLVITCTLNPVRAKLLGQNERLLAYPLEQHGVVAGGAGTPDRNYSGAERGCPQPQRVRWPVSAVWPVRICCGWGEPRSAPEQLRPLTAFESHTNGNFLNRLFARSQRPRAKAVAASCEASLS